MKSDDLGWRGGELTGRANGRSALGRTTDCQIRLSKLNLIIDIRLPYRLPSNLIQIDLKGKTMAEIIRQGDPTSHGGTVIEGSLYDICMGKPIAFMGHKVSCPKCKGIFPIAEGAPNTTFYGRGVALAGMKTACGATLIATQFTDTAESGGGGSSAASDSKESNRDAANGSSAQALQRGAAVAATGSKEFNEKFMLIDDETGDPLPNTEYAIRRASGEIEHGTTDANGCTHLLATTASAEEIDIYV